jgi:hypothetical protein
MREDQIYPQNVRCKVSYKLSAVKLLVGILCTMGVAQAQLSGKLSAQPSHSSPGETHASSALLGLPLRAQTHVSARLGREVKGYHVRRFDAGFHIENASQKLAADFVQEGVKVGQGAEHWTMSFRGYGYGDDVIGNLDRVAPRASLNRVEYRRGPLTEWYVNGPVGLEQGFTLNQPPSAAKGQPLTIVLDLSGDLSASVDQASTGLILSKDEGKPELHYAGLTAYDATGKNLPAWLELKGAELRLRVQDAGAKYPVIVDPVMQLAELTASDGVNGDALGISVAIDGNTIVVGAPGATINHSAGQGAAYVFVKPSTGWQDMTQTAKLTASDGLDGDAFGGAVGIAGNTIVVGACSQSGMCNGPGKVYVYTKPANGWHTTSNFAAILAASDGLPNDGFSNEMSISEDGSTVVVGAANAAVNGQPSAGKVYVFVRPRNGRKTVTETAQLTEPVPTAYDDFSCVSISADGSTIFVGALQFNLSGNIATGPGAAYIFLRPAGGWRTTSNAQAVLTASDGVVGDLLGFCQAGSKCLSSDGTTVLAPAPYANGFQGKGYIFVKPPAGWRSTSQFNAELTPNDGTSQVVGWSAAITHNAALLGAVAGSEGGAAYLVLKPKNGWRTTSNYAAKLSPSNPTPGDDFAFSLAMSGQNAVVGAIEQTPLGPGAAYVFGK